MYFSSYGPSKMDDNSWHRKNSEINQDSIDASTYETFMVFKTFLFHVLNLKLLKCNNNLLLFRGNKVAEYGNREAQMPLPPKLIEVSHSTLFFFINQDYGINLFF
jgi:hypothetical protein